MNTEQQLSILIATGNEFDFITFVSDSGLVHQPFSTFLNDWYESFTFNKDIEPILALMEHTDNDYDDCEQAIEQGDYLVLTDGEADDQYETYIENLLDDCILPTLPESVRNYFDRESWINDYKMESCRGQSLAGYDGHEYYETINSTEYYIYKN